MNPKQMCYAGGDLNLTTTKYWTNVDSSSASDVTALRKAAKNILYSIANRAYRRLYYRIPHDYSHSSFLCVYVGVCAVFFYLLRSSCAHVRKTRFE